MAIMAVSLKSESGDDYTVLAQGTLLDVKNELDKFGEELKYLMVMSSKVICDVLTERELERYVQEVIEESQDAE